VIRNHDPQSVDAGGWANPGDESTPAEPGIRRHEEPGTERRSGLPTRGRGDRHQGNDAEIGRHRGAQPAHRRSGDDPPPDGSDEQDRTDRTQDRETEVHGIEEKDGEVRKVRQQEGRQPARESLGR